MNEKVRSRLFLNVIEDCTHITRKFPFAIASHFAIDKSTVIDSFTNDSMSLVSAVAGGDPRGRRMMFALRRLR